MASLISFVYDKELSPDQLAGFRNHLDSREGLELMMRGEDAVDSGSDTRLIRLMENALNFDLTMLDYWISEMSETWIPIDKFFTFLKSLAEVLEKKPDYYQQFAYHPMYAEFLTKNFRIFVAQLLESCRLYMTHGAQKVMLVMD